MGIVGAWTLPRKLASVLVALIPFPIWLFWVISQFFGGGLESAAAIRSFGFMFAASLALLTGAQWCISTRHRILMKMAWNNIRRRRRNTALVLVGLLVGSAIVSSSLVIGDSLDATMENQFIDPLGDTDLVVRGYAEAQGRADLNTTRMLELTESLRGEPSIDGARVGRDISVSVLVGARETGTTGVNWLAMDTGADAGAGFPPIGGEDGVEFAEIEAGAVVINEALADEIDGRVGDQIELHWFDVDELTGSSISRHASFDVQSIVPNLAVGTSNGRTPMAFTGLSEALRLQEVEDVNRVEVSVTDVAGRHLGAESEAYGRVHALLNATLTGEDAGLMVQADSQSVAIARTTGDGLLRAAEIASLEENISAVDETASTVGMLQVALLNIAQADVNLSGLASATTLEMDRGGGWDWYATSAGLSLQSSNGTWYVYTPDADDETVHDIFLAGDGQAFAASDVGLRWLDLAPDVPDFNVLEVPVQAVTMVDDSVYALSLDDGDVVLRRANTTTLLDGAPVWENTSLISDGTASEVSFATDETHIHVLVRRLLGSATCAIDLATQVHACVDDAIERRLIFAHEGAAFADDGVAVHRITAAGSVPATSLGLPNASLLAQDEGVLWLAHEPPLWAWNGTGFEALSEVPPERADGRSIHLDDASIFFSSPHGVIHLDRATGEQSGRLPHTLRIDALNRVPLSVVAFDPAMPGMASPAPGTMALSSWAGDTLGLSVGENLTVRGLLPAIRGDREGLGLVLGMVDLTVPAPPGQAGLSEITVGMVHLADAERLAAGNPGERSALMVAGMADAEAVELMRSSLESWANASTTTDSAGIHVDRAKRSAVENTADVGEQFSMLFLIFGTFVILAGILLVINIFVMLGDERKPEMGMARAIGMTRGDIRALFVQEGTLLGFASALIGAHLGIGVAWLLMQGMDIAFRDTLGWAVVFDWSGESIQSGFLLGFIVTWVTLWLSSVWISRLNVVAAMRGLPTRMARSLPWWSILVVAFLVFAALACGAIAFLVGDAETGSRHAWWMLGGFLLLLGAVPIALAVGGWVLPESARLGPIRWHRRTGLPRLVMGCLGLAMVAWGWFEDPVRAEWEQGAFSLIVLGVFLVGAGVLIFTSIAPLIARAVARSAAPLSGRLAAVLPTSLSYPLATPFRTSMTMGMFSLVVFAVVILSGYSAMFGDYMEDLGAEAGGEFEFVAFGQNLDFEGDIGDWDLGDAHPDDFDAVATIHSGMVRTQRADAFNDSAGWAEYEWMAIRGFDANWTAHGGLSLQYWAQDSHATEADVWAAVLADPSLVIVDYTIASSPDAELYSTDLDLVIGDAIVIADPFNDGVNRTVFVAGVLTQEASIMLNGAFITAEVAQTTFEASPSSVWFSLDPGASVASQEAVAAEVQAALLEDGGTVVVIEVAFAKAQSFFLSMFSLLKSFLGLGLAVGIAGLAVVTIRNVSERRHQIGVLRAIGFRRSMVVGAFLTELTWVSLLGIFNGALVGIGFHYALYKKFLAPEGATFTMPWLEVTVIIVGAYLLTVSSTIWPVREAASIRPAEALRDGD